MIPGPSVREFLIIVVGGNFHPGHVFPKNGPVEGGEFSGLPDLYEFFQVLIGPCRVVFGFQVVVEELGDALPEAGGEAAFVIFDDGVGGDAGLPVDEFQQQSALGDGHFPEGAFEVFEELFLDGADVAFPPKAPVVLGGEGAVHLAHQMAGGQGVGVNAREAPDQFVVVSPLFLALARAAREDIGRGKDVQEGGVAVFHLHAHVGAAAFDAVGLDLPPGHGFLAFAGPVHGAPHVILGRCGQRRQKQREDQEDMKGAFHGLQR